MKIRGDLASALRTLATQLAPSRDSRPCSLLQGRVVSIEADTCTLEIGSGSLHVSNWRWLVQAYTPTVDDVVWILDGGPGSKFILGSVR